MQGDWVDVWLSVMDARGLGRCMAVSDGCKGTR